MINISTSSKLDIILPNTNKALQKVLSSATQKELEVLSQGKDLKSVMSSILKQSANNSNADKELLTLVKNNPTLKNLGDVTTTVKDLLNSLKTEKNSLPIETKLKSFLTDIKDLKNTQLKQKFENSGVFLESKLKNAQSPQVELKNTLISLAKTLQTTQTSPSRSIANEAKLLLNSELLKSASNADVVNNLKINPKTLDKLAQSVESIITQIKSAQKGSDTIHNPNLAKALTSLQHLVEPKTLTPENFKLSTIKEPLQEVSQHLNKSFTVESKTLLGALDKIFASLKSVEQTSTTPKSSIEALIEKNVPTQITKLAENINSVMKNSDPIFSKDATALLNKLELLNSATKLNPQQNVKEIISNDLKAILLQAGDEIAKSNNHPNQTEILKNIDKLSLQIDNYQLISHLSNGSSLYLPFSWDMLEEGNIEMKKDEENRFYCDINLKLKEYGPLNLKLTLYDKNQFNLHIYSSNDEFKELMRENIPELRSALIDVQITPREIRIFEPKEKKQTSAYSEQNDSFHIGFEVMG